MGDPVGDSYDKMAESYHLIFEDWHQSVARQSSILDTLLKRHGLAAGAAVLDCACGIGTQALGLARIGYHVTGTDISANEIARAGEEAVRQKLGATFFVADFRRLEDRLSQRFDAVIAMDNALPHMIAEEDLLLACQSIRARVDDGGLFMASIRDYDEIIKDRPRCSTPTVIDTGTGRRVIFQVWDWDRDVYDFSLYIVVDENSKPETAKFVSRYRAITRDELSSHLVSSGFTRVEWLAPKDSGYYQPIVVAWP